MTDIFRQMFDNSPDGILQMDAQGCVVLANRCAETMFGYGPGQLAGTQVEELMPPRHRPARCTTSTAASTCRIPSRAPWAWG